MSIEENRRKTWAFSGVYHDTQLPTLLKNQRASILAIDGRQQGPRQKRMSDARKMKLGLCTTCGRPLRLVSLDREKRASSWRCDHCALDLLSPDENGNRFLLRLAEVRCELSGLRATPRKNRGKAATT
jgi:hypothetical protein